MKATVYTADIGHYDKVWKPVAQQAPESWEVDWVFLADDYSRAEEIEAAGWTFRWIGGPEGVPLGAKDRLLGRWAKCHPHVLFPDSEATIWVDACLEIVDPRFLVDVIRHVHHLDPIAMFEHPDRDNARAEVHAADTLIKYEGNDHRAMVQVFEDVLGGPYSDLWAMTMIARWNRPEVRLVDRLVWLETKEWSSDSCTALDQLILPYVLQATGQDVVALEAPHPVDYHLQGNLWNNGWFNRHPHRRDT